VHVFPNVELQAASSGVTDEDNLSPEELLIYSEVRDHSVSDADAPVFDADTPVSNADAPVSNSDVPSRVHSQISPFQSMLSKKTVSLTQRRRAHEVIKGARASLAAIEAKLSDMQVPQSMYIYTHIYIYI